MTRQQRQPDDSVAPGIPARYRRATSSLAVSVLGVAVCLRQLAAADIGGSTGAESVAVPEAFTSGFLTRHCAECHTAAADGTEPEGGVVLALPPDDAGLPAQRKLWETALRRVETGEMPPPDRPRPSPADVAAFVASISKRYDEADLRAPPDPGRVTMRRLNRFEYRNTIRDLVGVEFDPTADFPSDEIGHGSDTIGDVLTLSPLLLERYLDAAEAVMERAIPVTTPSVAKRSRAPQFTEPASRDVPRLIVGGYRRMTTAGTEPIELGPINSPFEWAADGEYEFRTQVYADPDAPRPVRVTVLVSGKDLPQPSAAGDLDRLSGSVPRPARVLESFVITGTASESADAITLRIPPLPGRERILLALEKPTAEAPPTAVFVGSLELAGPLDPRPETQKRLLACDPRRSREEQTREVLGRFLRRAFRRSLDSGELDRHAALVEAAMKEGRGWHEGVQLAMQAALSSPKFLFRAEFDDRPDAKEVRPLDEFQLASRLSYFLWSTMPDDELLDLAERGQLAAGIEGQVRRMLADPRADALVTSFAMQWLQLKRIEFVSPDGGLFPTFDNALRTAMIRETELFVGSIFREDRSLLELIDAGTTFVNGPLAKHYGLEAAYRAAGGTGEDFRRVPCADRTRGGLLSQAGILTATSNPTRTSPVKRGRWVLEQLLGEPPPPPPPNVPELAEDEAASATASLRERMEVHRRNAACAGCHARMDAIGFALENYDAVGGFRGKDGSFEIDAGGTFPDGTRFSGPAGLKDVLLARKREFCRCLAEKMMTYALGRGLEPADRRSIERIIDRLESEDHRMSVLVAGIVSSDAFRERRGGGHQD